MNVLLASDANVERAGVCLFMLQFARGIRKIDNKGKIVAYFRKEIIDKGVEKQFNEINVDIVCSELPQNGSSISPANRNKVRRDVRCLMKRISFDVIHVNSSAAGFSSVILSEGKKRGVPVRISHSHGRNPVGIVKNTYLWALKKNILKNATSYAGCSLDAGEYMFGKEAINSTKWHFIPNTIDSQKFIFDKDVREVYRNKINLSDDDILIGSVGMLTVNKNHSFLLPLIKSLNEGGNRAYLVILGEGEQRSYLEEQAKLLGIEDRVFLLGVSDEVPEWMSAMDYYAMPSFSEGLPLGAVEAQANGLRCILSDSIPRDVNIGGNVIFLPVDKGCELWKDKILSLRETDYDERRNGVDVIKKAGFDISSIEGYIKELYSYSKTQGDNMRELSAKEIKKLEFDMLVLFDKVCKKYNLYYTLCGGTLLGAVRHKGFIPWDDDIDVMMTRPEFNKLCKLVYNKKIKLPDEFEFVSWFTDTKMSIPFLKLVNKNTRVEEKYMSNDKYLWIDILVIDGCPDDDDKLNKMFIQSRKLRDILFAKQTKPRTGKTKIKAITKDAARIALKPISGNLLCKMLEKLSSTYDFDSCKQIGCIEWGYGPQERVQKAPWLVPVELEFEGRLFPCPSNYDEYLSHLYGDYMKLPPEEKRVAHEMVVTIFE